MSAPYQLTLRAHLDVTEIVLYISRRNRTAARKLHEQLEQTFWLLAKNPEIGEQRDDLSPGLRCFSLRPYAIFFRRLESGEASVEIVRVVHGARDFSSLDF